jgi:cytosine/adenosine deaminase-related metal-dependent hydrolase
VIEDGALAVTGERIVAVGTSAELCARYIAHRTLNAQRKAVLPGLIDCHGHAGHGLLKTLGGGDSEAWTEACRVIYTTGSDEEFWYAEAALSALERLKCGTTTGVSLFGGGDSIMRVDDPRYAARHCAAIAEAGTRSFLAVGPSRPPAPRTYASWHGGQRQDRGVLGRDVACCRRSSAPSTAPRTGASTSASSCRCTSRSTGRITWSSRARSANRPPSTASSRGAIGWA